MKLYQICELQFCSQNHSQHKFNYPANPILSFCFSTKTKEHEKCEIKNFDENVNLIVQFSVC